MINDMIKSFKKAIDINPSILLDNYKLKDGLYLRLDISQPVGINENNYIIVDNKKDEVESYKIKNPELYKWIKEADYCSSILNDDTNKAIDLPAKKIHSTNWCTLFIKKDGFPVVGKQPIDKKILINLINRYFDKLKLSEEKFIEIYDKSNYKTIKLKGEKKDEFLKEYFKDHIDYIRSKVRASSLEKSKQFIINNFDKIVEVINKFSKDNEFKEYIKIFLYNDIDIYRKEYKIYIIPKIFNVNDYNIFMNGYIYGLPSNNITTNSKKPYLLLRSMQCTAPYRSKHEDVEVAKCFFDWLIANGKFKEIKVDYNYKFDGTEEHRRSQSYYSIHLNKDAEIDYYDNIPFDIPKLRFKLYNFLNIKDISDKESKKKSVIADEKIDDYLVLRKRFSDYFFNGRLNGFIKNLDPDIETNVFTSQMKALLDLSKDALFDFFAKGIDISMKSIVNKLTLDLIMERMKNTVQGFNLNNVGKAFNLRMSLLKYFDLGGMEVADKIKPLAESFKTKIEKEGVFVECENDEEFYFAVGQLSYYILSQSETSNKTFGIFEPILNVKNSDQLKKKIKEIFLVYKHAISSGNIKFKNALSMVMGYEIDKKIEDKMQNILLAGLLANNIFYEKKGA